MRTLVMAVVALGLLAAPSLGVLYIKVVADKTNLVPGESTTIRVLAQGTAYGVFSLGGYISTIGTTDVLTTTAGSIVFSPLFSPTDMLHPMASTPGANGTWGGWGDYANGSLTSGIGSMQTDYHSPNVTIGRSDYVEICHYTVVADAVLVADSVTLRFVAKNVYGYRPMECNKNDIVGGLADAVITVVPEPATLPGDVDGDGHVNVVDLLCLVDAFGSVLGDANYDARCDFNRDGDVDVVDLLILM